MSDMLHFEIVSPERLLKDAEAAMVVVPGSDGDFGVLPGHAPMMSTIRPGTVEVYADEGATPERLFVKGGLAQVSENGLTLLAEEVLALDTVDRADLAQQIANAREDLEDASDEMAKARIEKELSWMQALADIVDN